MKSAGYFEKDIDVLELLHVDLAHSCQYNPFDVLISHEALHLVCGLLLCRANREACCVRDDALEIHLCSSSLLQTEQIL